MDLFSKKIFTVRDILHHEAYLLSKHCPSRDEPREPSLKADTFTELRKFGTGTCQVKRWPDDEDPYAWGCRNEPLLLDEVIHAPATWEIEYDDFYSLLGPIDYTRIGPGPRVSDAGSESRFQTLLDSILHRITATAFVYIIQLWRRHSEYETHPDYKEALKALCCFSLGETQASQRMPSQNNDLAVLIPSASCPVKDTYQPFHPLVVGNVQPTGMAELIHPVTRSGCRTADDVLSSILSNTADEHTTTSLFKKFGVRNDWQKLAASHIVHMSCSTSTCASQMSFSTSLWGYLRFFIQVESGDSRLPILYITRNMASNTAWSDDYRMDESLNFKLLCQLYYFVLSAMLKTRGPRILPPDLRANKKLLSFFAPTTDTRPKLILNLSRSKLGELLGHILFSLLAALWEFVLRYWGTSLLESVRYVSIEVIDGKLERILEDGNVMTNRCLYLRFNSWEDRDAAEIGINHKAGLVLKVFHDAEIFRSELNAYLMLREARVQHVPNLLGTFKMPGTKGAMLMTLVGEKIQGGLSNEDRHHLGEAVKNIHRANIHHHDLRLDNFVRAADGILRIIDFGHSCIADSCEYNDDICPDEAFLAEWG